MAPSLAAAAAAAVAATKHTTIGPLAHMERLAHVTAITATVREEGWILPVIGA